MSKEIVKLCTCDFVSLYGVQFLKIYMYPFFMQSMLNSCLYFSILLFLHKQTHNLYPEQKKIILNKCILYVFFDYCYSDRLLSQMNYFSTEVIFEEGRVLYQTHNFFHVKRNCETMPVVTLFHFLAETMAMPLM